MSRRGYPGSEVKVVTLGHALDRDPKTASYDRPLTIAAAIRRQRLAFRLPTVAVVARGDEAVPVLRRDWATRKVRRGETLLFVPVPQGSQGGSLLATIAAIALSVVAGPAGTAIAGALFGGSAMAAALVSAGIIVGGSLLINALMPKPPAPAEAERVHIARASSNRALPLGTIPGAYGRMRFAPPLAAVPYAEFEGNDQVLYQLHCVSLGKWVPKRWEIGKTLAWTSADGFTEAFTDIRMQIVHPGDDLDLFPANVVVADTAGAVVPDPPATLGPVTVNAAGTEISRIGVDLVFPAGLYRRASGGGASSATRRVIARARPIDSDGNPTGGYAVLFDETFTRKTPTPQRFTRHADVTPGRYEVTVEATNADTTDAGETINRVVWAGLRGYLTDWTLPEGVTLIATAIRANDQISQQSANEYFFTGVRCLPIYDADEETWSDPVETRAIAWAAADILRDADYGAGLDDGRYDLGWLAAYNQLWAGRGDRFDGVFDRAIPARDALDQVLRTGRAYHVRLGGRIGFVRDEPKHVRRHVFGPWNTLRDSHIRDDQWLDDERPGQLRVRYLDETVWAERDVTAAIAGNGATPAESRFLSGIVDRDHAWREGIYDTASNEYRRSFRLFQVEHEGRQLVRGDPVLYHDPMMEEAAPARLVARDGDTFTIDRDFAPEDGETYHLIVRDKRGREWGPVLIDGFPDARTIALDAADRLVVESQHGLLAEILPGAGSEPARLSILAGDHRLFDGLLVSARPAGERWWEVLIVNDDQRVHLADETEIIPAPYTPPELFAPPPEAPSIEASSLYARARNGTMHIELEAGWRPAPGAQRYVAEISYDDDAGTLPDGASWTPVHDGVGTRFTAVIMPNDWTLRVAAIGVRQGLWRTVSGTSPAPLLAPGTVDEDSLVPRLRAFMQQLDVSQQAALGPGQRALLEELDRLGHTMSGIAATIELYLQNQIVRYIGTANENITEIRTIANGLADFFLGVFVGDEVRSGAALARLTAASLPGGVGSTISFQVRAAIGDLFKLAGVEIYAFADSEGGDSGVILSGNKVLVRGEDGVLRNLLMVGMEDTPRDAPITVEGADKVVRVDLAGRQMRHFTLMDDDAEMRWPINAAVMDYTHDAKRVGAGHEWSFGDGIVTPLPTGMSDLNGAVNQFAISIKSLNPRRMRVRYEGSYTDTPIISRRGYKGDSRVSTSSTTVGPGRIEGLDFRPGDFLLAICSGFVSSTDSPLRPGFNIGPAAVSDWEQIVGAHAAAGGGGGNWHAMGTRAFWKIATGSEGDLQAFIYTIGSQGPRVSGCNYHFFSYDFLGGSLSVCPDPTAVIAGASGTLDQTIKTDGFSPSLAINMASYALRSEAPPTPDQSFSETPDENRPLASNHPVRSRVKIKQFDSSGDDVTTSLAGASVGLRSFLSFGIKME